MKLTFFLFVSLLFFACTKNRIDVSPIPPCDGTVTSYTTDIAPLIKAKCSTGLGSGTGCHDAWILTYNGLKGAVENGTLLQTTILDQSMPQIPNSFGIAALTEAEKNLLICWVENGALEN